MISSKKRIPSSSNRIKHNFKNNNKDDTQNIENTIELNEPQIGYDEENDSYRGEEKSQDSDQPYAEQEEFLDQSLDPYSEEDYQEAPPNEEDLQDNDNYNDEYTDDDPYKDDPPALEP